MGKEKLIELIDQTNEIKKGFNTCYRTVVDYLDKPPKKVPYQSIRSNSDFLFWKCQIEAELELLPRNKTVSDLYDYLHGITKTNRYNEDIYFNLIEAKLEVLRKMIVESNKPLDEKVIIMNKSHKLFVSHSSKDADYIEILVELFETLGLQEDEIICSSVPPYCIPLDNKVYDWLVNEFQQSELHVVYALSEYYYDSAASLNEMGAAWAMKHKWTGILLPGFSFDEIDGCIDKTQISIKLDDGDKKTLNFRLGELKDRLADEFGLRPLSPAVWERKRDGFLERIASITKKKNCKNGEKTEYDQQYIPTVGKDDVGFIPVDVAFLLVYAAAGNGHIIKIATLSSPTQVSADGKQFMADYSQRESARWQEALDILLNWGWVKPVGGKGEVFEVTGTGYTKADWLKEAMCIDTNIEPLEELKNFE